ncbi:peptidoglycan DD-metalloendopeptidase family protein [Chitinophaga sp. Mgbs1]|uniref:Peptidoglycan DD-metalloendopeptidase family protein n=1 Tax=Chitinophaga solisilvae TaxID=1233460 RepID=A0A9Q5DD07_9BACT|nr:peptidoglycan DD-metalloendopeptidase family protein [Chitinophaga solisilvae]
MLNSSKEPPVHLVCEGAVCSCDKSVVPAILQVTSHHKYYINDSKGSEKLIATTQDNSIRSINFRTCVATGKPEPCTAQLQWQVTSAVLHLSEAGNAPPLTDDSSATCLSRGGRIRIISHGQATGGQTDNQQTEHAEKQEAVCQQHDGNTDHNNDHHTQQHKAAATSGFSIEGPANLSCGQSGCYNALPSAAGTDPVILRWYLSDTDGCLISMTSGESCFEYRFDIAGSYVLRLFSGEDGTDMTAKNITVTDNQPFTIKSTATIVRPDQCVTFTLSGCTTATNISWRQEDAAGNGIALETAPAATSIMRTFPAPGWYTISVTTETSYAYTFITVSNNAVRAISSNKRPHTSIPVTFSVSEMIFPVFSEKEVHKLKWQLDGPESTTASGIQDFSHIFSHHGKYTLYAYLYDKTREGRLEFQVITPAVHGGKWVDSDGNIIRKAGYGQDICIYFEQAGLEEETVLLEVFARQTMREQLLLSQQIKLPATAGVYYTMHTDDNIRQKINSGWNQPSATLYFKIKPTGSLKIQGNGQPFPVNPADYLQLNEERKIRQAYFTDAQDRREYFAISIKQATILKIYATNLIGRQLDITFLLARKPAPLNKPLTLYPAADIHSLTKDDTILYRCKGIIDKKGELPVTADLKNLPVNMHLYLIYAVIQLPDHNAVYTKLLMVYRNDKIQLSPATRSRSAAVIERVNIQQRSEGCDSLVWGAKVSCAFRMKVREIARKLKADPNHLMTCMAFETGGGFLPYQLSGYSTVNTPLPEKLTDGLLERHAVGLVQFTKDAVKEINRKFHKKITKRQLANMQPIEQLDYVYLHLKRFTGRLNTLNDCYMAIIKPSLVGSNPNDIVFSQENDLKNNITFYSSNKGLDTNQDLIITQKEVSAIIHSKYSLGLTHKNSCVDDCSFRSVNTTISTKKLWHHPIDNLQLRGWYNTWAPGRSKYGIIEFRKSGKHQGIDFYARAGSKIYACVDGQIYTTYFSNSYGNVIILNGNYEEVNYYFMYAHLQNQGLYNPGDFVNAGTVIGYTGKTGNASTLQPKQEHLHFEIRTKSNVGRGFDGRVDPFSIIKELNNTSILNPNENLQNA